MAGAASSFLLLLHRCELAADGAFSADTLASQPLSFQIGDEWLALLRAADAASGSWLTDLHIAIALIERGEVCQA